MSKSQDSRPSSGASFRHLLHSIFHKSGAKRVRLGSASGLPALTGARIDRYRLENPLGEGRQSAVYLATDDSKQRVAIKVLDPDHAQRPQFWQQLELDIRTVAAISHPNILPVYRLGITEQGWIYVAMAMAARGSLKQLLDKGALSSGEAQQVLEAVAGALHSAHEVGVVHHDVKLSNVLFDPSGRALLSDFGMPRTSYGLLGTPGYIAPEQVLGSAPDQRADVHALGVLAFEMLTGTSPYLRPSATETILATVQEPVPLASERNPRLPAEVDLVLTRALAKVPEERYATAVDFARDLAEIPLGRERPQDSFRPGRAAAALPMPGHRDQEEELFQRSVAKLEEVLNLALTASVMVDQTSFIVGWNALAQQTFGWSGEEVIGRSLLTTLIPPQYRELHERGLRKYLETGEGPVLGKKLELSALHKDGREFPIELSITEAVRSGGDARILSFVRDISQEKLAKQMAAVQSSVARAIEEAGTLQAAASRVLESIGGQMGWSAGVLWLIDSGGQALQFQRFWHAEGIDSDRFEEAVRAAGFKRGEGVPGKAWASGEPVWFEDLMSGEDSPRVIAALRASLRTAVALPIQQAGVVFGVVELFASAARREDPFVLNSLYDLGRKIASRSAGSLHAASTGLLALPMPGHRDQEEELFQRSVAKLEEVLNLALTASVMVDQTSFIVGWNALAQQTFGWSGEEVIGRSLLTTLIPPQYRELHERGLRKYLETGEGPVLGKKLELSALHKDGREFPIELSITEAVRSGGDARILSFVRDISQEKLAKQMAAVQSSVARAIEEAGTLQAAASRVLESIGGQMGWSAGVLWLIDSGGQALQFQRFWHAEGIDSDRFEEAVRAAGFKRGEGVPGKAWASGEPVWFEDLMSGEDSPRVIAALRASLRTAVALPIQQAGVVFGVVELFASATRREDPFVLNSLYDLGRKIASAPPGQPK
jgi:PAS domain S-box-containing protein